MFIGMYIKLVLNKLNIEYGLTFNLRRYPYAIIEEEIKGKKENPIEIFFTSVLLIQSC